MAKIIETVFLVKLSQIVKDNADSIDRSGFEELPGTLEQVVQELVSDNVVVEVEESK